MTGKKKGAATRQTALRKRGAPTVRSEALINRVLCDIADGKSTAAACAQAGITRQTWYVWMQGDAELSDKYARAKAWCADLYAEQIIEIADDTSRDWTTNAKGDTVVDREAVQRSALKIDARKWYAAKLAPRRYGNDSVTTIEGGQQPVRRRIEIAFVSGDGRVVTPQRLLDAGKILPIKGD